MQIGFNLPSGGPLAMPEPMARLAQEGEALGYGYATVSDHVVIPTDIHAKYPYTDTGEFPASSRGERHEQLTQAMFVAAKTTRLRIVTSVMVVPHRPAMLAAKMISTIDVLSGGRLTLGIGAGWLQEEFEALQVPDFAARGRVTDEYILAAKELWTSAAPRFEGEFVRFHDIGFAPKPVQPGGPPIWVGGESGPALRRTAKLGDAWYPIGTNPSFPLDSLARYRSAIAKLHGLVEKAGRDPAKVGLAYRVQKYGPEVPATAGDGERRLFSGQPGQIADDLKAMRDLGVQGLDLTFPGATVEEVVAGMRAFRDEVMGRL
ncbi:TIGR03619 family F420-dependent LLM class oxidoreductase [Paracraurococcus lichenis]|uniref:TIGR03619 family F420-dependent LLM class oxidoreductase n=1 Tax=Paracraurococcus lichenis TaxID=3064888 RepID=A0ABT9DZA4_9PROT|nr:TIGR03619 family F420-dependent LLM class oxidoreductase [Paracraurococcus sp. LOR1-02]MDO9709247.1 TIGR03619 family F420-dependent LLM class oxidoreductase [Paracraurococcus sp. LOR1-02]